jgi:RNA ligase (TIGR02306 family)
MENQNSVCFVACIGEIKEIEGAQNIEQAFIGGWSCIIPKGQYSSGYLVVVATTNAVIPQELSDGMNVTNYLRKGQRVKTVKLRGVYSECLIIPIGFIPDKYRYEGADCMELLGIYKYEPPAVQVQLASGKIRKCKENEAFKVYYKFPNIKNVNGMFNENDEVEVTRKIHGTSSRYGIVRKVELTLLDKFKLKLNKMFGAGGDSWKYYDYEFYIGSHNVVKDIQDLGTTKSFRLFKRKKEKTHFYPTDVWSEIAEKHNIREKLWHLFKQLNDVYEIGSGIVIYGEIYGPGIQKNYDYGLKEIEYVGFDVTINGEYVPCSTSRTFHKMLNLKYVPVLSVEYYSDELLTKYTFDKIEGSKVPHEGVVIKSTDGNRHKVAKIINPDYLIYGEKHNVGDSH